VYSTKRKLRSFKEAINTYEWFAKQSEQHDDRKENGSCDECSIDRCVDSIHSTTCSTAWYGAFIRRSWRSSRGWCDHQTRPNGRRQRDSRRCRLCESRWPGPGSDAVGGKRPARKRSARLWIAGWPERIRHDGGDVRCGVLARERGRAGADIAGNPRYLAGTRSYRHPASAQLFENPRRADRFRYPDGNSGAGVAEQRHGGPVSGLSRDSRSGRRTGGGDRFE